MKTKLASDKFKDRLTPPSGPVLDGMLREYVDAIDRGRDSKVLLTEIPLRLREYDVAGGVKGAKELEAVVLRGYRIYKVKRGYPSCPELMVIYSKLTRQWHRVGFASGLPELFSGFASYTNHGCYSLGAELQTNTTLPVEDNVLRRCLLIDKASDLGVDGYHLRRAVTFGEYYHLRKLHEMPDAEVKGMPNHLILLRSLRAKPEAFAAMLKIVDQYGMPDGILGEMFRHVDNFRTF